MLSAKFWPADRAVYQFGSTVPVVPLVMQIYQTGWLRNTFCGGTILVDRACTSVDRIDDQSMPKSWLNHPLWHFKNVPFIPLLLANATSLAGPFSLRERSRSGGSRRLKSHPKASKSIDAIIVQCHAEGGAPTRSLWTLTSM